LTLQSIYGKVYSLLTNNLEMEEFLMAPLEFQRMVHKALHDIQDGVLLLDSAFLYRVGHNYAEILQGEAYDLPRNEFGQLLVVLDELPRRYDLRSITCAVEPGIGNSPTSFLLASSIAKHNPRFLYIGIDVDEEAARQSLLGISHLDQPNVQFLRGNYNEVFPDLSQQSGRTILFFPGSTYGNFTREGGRRALSRFRSRLKVGDYGLFGLDCTPSQFRSVDEIVAGYSDPPTIRFYENGFNRLCEECHADFTFRNLELCTYYCTKLDAVVTDFVLQNAEEVTFCFDDRQPVSVHMKKGFRVRVEISRKFSREIIESELRGTGWSLRETWTDGKYLFAFAEAV
jgi:uncharacterized SAM-dependent methyltransferase